MTRMLAHRRTATLGGLLALSILLACLGSAPPRLAASDATCAAVADAGVQWLRISSVRERPSLDRWCAGVGAAVRTNPATAAETLTTPFAVVSWNTHVGAADLDRFTADLEAGRLTARPVAGFVLLLQETYRAGDAVPSTRDVKWASAILGAGSRSSRVEAVGFAARRGLSAIYVPSMRNGPPGVTAEDRGNALLSTARLIDPRATELPLERQRRVAVAATVMVKTGSAPALPVRLVTTHFTNMVMHHLWVLSESGRLRQARGLAQTLPKE
jgi:hypothetical protein